MSLNLTPRSNNSGYSVVATRNAWDVLSEARFLLPRNLSNSPFVDLRLTISTYERAGGQPGILRTPLTDSPYSGTISLL